MNRIPGTYRRGTALYLLPTIPDDAPDNIKNAIAIRNACATEGRCPSCRTVGELTLDQHGLGWLTFRHEPDCPVLRNPEDTAP